MMRKTMTVSAEKEAVRFLPEKDVQGRTISPERL
jgi:hypothetical protein